MDAIILVLGPTSLIFAVSGVCKFFAIDISEIDSFLLGLMVIFSAGLIVFPVEYYRKYVRPRG